MSWTPAASHRMTPFGSRPTNSIDAGRERLEVAKSVDPGSNLERAHRMAAADQQITRAKAGRQLPAGRVDVHAGQLGQALAFRGRHLGGDPDLRSHHACPLWNVSRAPRTPTEALLRYSGVRPELRRACPLTMPRHTGSWSFDLSALPSTERELMAYALTA